MRILAIGLLVLAGIAGQAQVQAQAQQPTKAQTDAIRASCRSDFLKNCSGVTPGGKDALACLQKNSAKLSAGCQTAVTAVPAVAP